MKHNESVIPLTPRMPWWYGTEW